MFLSQCLGVIPLCLHVKQKKEHTRPVSFHQIPCHRPIFTPLAGYTFTKFINELGKLIDGDSYTKTNNADTCIKSEYQQQLQSGEDPWSWDTFVSHVCCQREHTHRQGAAASDTYTPVACVNLTQQASRSYLVCLPVCLPTVFSLLLRCTGLCLMWSADCCKWQLQLGGWWVRAEQGRAKWQITKVVRFDKQPCVCLCSKRDN